MVELEFSNTLRSTQEALILPTSKIPTDLTSPLELETCSSQELERSVRSLYFHPKELEKPCSRKDKIDSNETNEDSERQTALRLTISEINS